MLNKYTILLLFYISIFIYFILNNNSIDFFVSKSNKKNIQIGIIIPVTSNKRNYISVKDIDFFKILLSSFLKTFDKSLKYQYNFYLGFDDDDKFYLKNKTLIISHFKKITKKYPVFKISLIKIDNYGKLGEIWSRLVIFLLKMVIIIYIS